MSPSPNFAVVVPAVPIPHLDYDPLKPFDEKYFDRAVDKILSEEADLEESRNEIEELDIDSGIENDNICDLSGQRDHDRQRAESCSPQSTTSAPASDSPPSYAEDPRIFAGVDEEKREEILMTIAKMPFVRKHPVLTSERRMFTKEVISLATAAGISQINSEALVQHVRDMFMNAYGIVATEENASAFGDEVNDLEEEEVPSQHIETKGKERQSGSSTRKRRHSEVSSSSTLERPESTPRVQAAAKGNSTEAAKLVPDMSPATAIKRPRKVKKVACVDCRKKKVCNIHPRRLLCTCFVSFC